MRHTRGRTLEPSRRRYTEQGGGSARSRHEGRVARPGRTIRRSQGEWREVVVLAGTATEYANEAFEIAVAQRDKSAEALITDI